MKMDGNGRVNTAMLGKNESGQNINIDMPRFIATRALICANSGGGKSYCVRKLLEETQDIMAIVLDIEGEFKTLREKFDYLLIGEGGDVPLSMKAADLVPKKLLELGVSTIIDISELKRGERVQYVKKFLEALMEAPRELWRPCIVILDEAHTLAGQQEKQDSTFAVIDLMTRGRKRGFCGVLCTQRISKLHKDAVAEANNVMIGRTGLDIDMKRAAEILGFTAKQDMLTLRDLEPGEFFVFGPAVSKAVSKMKVGEVQTTHPKVGMDLRERIVPPTDKIKAILGRLNELPKEADREKHDLATAQKRVRELEYELRKKPSPQMDTETLAKEKERAYRAGVNASELFYQKQIKSLKSHLKQTHQQMEKIRQFAVPLPLPECQTIVHTTVKPMASKPVERVVFRNESYQDKVDKGELPPIENAVKWTKQTKEILKFLALREGRTFSASQIGALTGYSSGSGGFQQSLRQLRDTGLIRENGNGYELVEASQAMEILGDEYHAPEKRGLEEWLRKLGPQARRIYELIHDTPDETFSLEEIGERLSYSSKSGGFQQAVRYLIDLGLAQRENGGIRFNSELMGI